jgi:hypothetical protein
MCMGGAAGLEGGRIHTPCVISQPHTVPYCDCVAHQPTAVAQLIQSPSSDKDPAKRFSREHWPPEADSRKEPNAPPHPTHQPTRLGHLGPSHLFTAHILPPDPPFFFSSFSPDKKTNILSHLLTRFGSPDQRGTPKMSFTQRFQAMSPEEQQATMTRLVRNAPPRTPFPFHDYSPPAATLD